MHSAKILAETEMNQHSGKILATIAFQIPVPANTNIYAIPQTYARCWSEGEKKSRSSKAIKSACARCWSEGEKKSRSTT